MNKILIIDDDRELCALIKRSVQAENIEADFCNTGKEGLQKLKEQEYQLVVLDVMMPGMDGFETLEEIRKENSLPILMFTSKNDSISKVRGLRAGADDYLTKPFDMDELIARIASLIRRYTRFNQQAGAVQKLDFDGLQIDLENRSVTTENGTFELPEKKTVIVAEHRLYYLVPYADRIFYMKHGSIVREFTGAEFQKLPPDELQGMGLRALDPFHLSPEAAPKLAAPQLHIKGFQFSYEKHGPLNVDIPDLTLPQGEIIGIIGNNGAGKSTFARCLCGLDKKAKGVLEMDGASYDAKQRRHISYMVMQDVNHQLFTEDVLDELMLSMDGEDEKADTARAKEILNSLDLLGKAKLHPMSLSGGEKQRVAIGSAIASDKKVLIFDEPTSGLDYRHMLEVSDNLNRLKKMGKSLFLITHDPELIYKCCTYLLFIQGSKVLWHRPMDGDAVGLLRAFFSRKQGAGVCNASG